ncbi:MAG: hypothetical protein ACRC1T_13420 [Clostridium chrysemydis]|uniref:hypothetical protein n=1 Tax=Clostridium chrysemydis TaxID=2665504 RepID=UPI003F33988B
MNKCIYLKTDENLTFDGEEHVFPAALGGIQKLPKGYVSDYVNGKLFSPLELNVMRESILSISRIFIGPGKRGKLNEKSQTKSKIGIYKDSNNEKNISLGYIKKGQPHQIPQLVVRYEEKPNCNLINVNTSFMEFLQELKNNKHLKKINLYDKSLGNNEFIIGYLEHKVYMLTKDKNIEFDYIEEIISKVVNEFNQGNYTSDIENIQPSLNLKMEFNIENFYRICAKIALNYLALKRGQEYVLNKRFDKLRNFILGEKVKINCNIIENDFDMRIEFPSESHKIFINENNGYMYAMINFYGTTNIYIELCKISQQDYSVRKIGNELDRFIGYICDWKSRVEYDLLEYIDMYNNHHERLNRKI